MVSRVSQKKSYRRSWKTKRPVYRSGLKRSSLRKMKYAAFMRALRWLKPRRSRFSRKKPSSFFSKIYRPKTVK